MNTCQLTPHHWTPPPRHPQYFHYNNYVKIDILQNKQIIILSNLKSMNILSPFPGSLSLVSRAEGNNIKMLI